MQTGITIIFLIITWISLIGFYLSSLLPQPIPVTQKEALVVTQKPTEYPQTKHIVYSYSLTNSTASNIKRSDFYTYTPIPHTPYQRLDFIDSKTPYTFIKDSFDNQIMHFKIKNMAPFSTQKIAIKVRVATTHQPNNMGFNIYHDYLENTKLLNLDNPEVVALAQKLTRNNTQQIIEDTFLWTMNSIRYSGYEQTEKSVVQTLKTREGDCTDYMHVFTALSRVNKIPTREIGGYIVKKNKVIHAQDYHNWAEYYAKEHWHLADPQNKKLDQQAGDYIAFRRYGSDPQSPLNQFHRYHITDQRIQILMN